MSIFVLWTNGMDNEKLADREWWETTLIYQIWPRGFQDSDGDGEGDLKGRSHKFIVVTNKKLKECSFQLFIYTNKFEENIKDIFLLTYFMFI